MDCRKKGLKPRYFIRDSLICPSHFRKMAAFNWLPDFKFTAPSSFIYDLYGDDSVGPFPKMAPTPVRHCRFRPVHMRGGLGQKYQWAMSHVFGLCLMSLGYVSCHGVVCFRAILSCVDRAHVFGQCFLCT